MGKESVTVLFDVGKKSSHLFCLEGNIHVILVSTTDWLIQEIKTNFIVNRGKTNQIVFALNLAVK